MTNWKQGELPPVGEECLAMHKSAGHEPLKVVINFIGKKTFNATWVHSGFEFCNEIAAFDFKPIKTPAEIERERVIERIMFLIGLSEEENISVVRECLTFAFDLGYISDPEKRVKGIGFNAFCHDLCSNKTYRETYNKWVKDGIIQGVDNDE